MHWQEFAREAAGRAKHQQTGFRTRWSALLGILAAAFVGVSAQAAPVPILPLNPVQTDCDASGCIASAAVEIRLFVWGTDIYDFQSNDAGVRRNIAISIADYFNDDVYSTTIIDIDVDPAGERTIVDFQVKKGSFVDWTDLELELISLMPTSPIFHKRLADNLDLSWDPTNLSFPDPFRCATKSPAAGMDICGSNDLFEFIAAGGAARDAANSQLMAITAIPVPAAAPLFLAGLAMLGFARRRRREKVAAARS